MPSARIVEMIRKWAANGYRTAEIARLVKLPPQEVRDIIAAGHGVGNKAAKQNGWGAPPQHHPPQQAQQPANDPWANEPQGFKGGFGAPDWTPSNNDDDF